MDNNKFVPTLLFVISNVAYLLVFISICISIGFSRNMLMWINGIFFAIYVLSLWKTGIDTYEFYGKGYFTADMLSIGIYANIPVAFFRTIPEQNFIVTCLIIIGLNEIVCVFWDILCHNNTHNEQAKTFHLIWVILTFIGMILAFVFAILIYCFDDSTPIIYFYILNIFSILYQIGMLTAWWVAKHNIEDSQDVNK